MPARSWKNFGAWTTEREVSLWLLRAFRTNCPEEAEPETGSNTGMLLAVLAVALVGGGAAFYFKVLRPKQQKAAAPQEDYGDELTDYDEPDGYGDEDDDGPPWDEEDDDGEEADK